MVPGRRTSSMLRDGEKLYTLHGYPVDISIDVNGNIYFPICSFTVLLFIDVNLLCTCKQKRK